MNFRHKAVEIIKEQMVKEGESPLLYCMLGDATDDPKNYEKAIELSKGKNARAYRSLGDYYYERKDYENTVTYLGKALELNTFQLKTMLRHGYSAIQLEKWDIAAQSYRNYCVHCSDVSKNVDILDSGIDYLFIILYTYCSFLLFINIFINIY